MGEVLNAEKGLNVSTGSRLIIWNAEAGQHGGGCCAQGRIVISSSTLSIQDATASSLVEGCMHMMKLSLTGCRMLAFSVQ